MTLFEARTCHPHLTRQGCRAVFLQRSHTRPCQEQPLTDHFERQWRLFPLRVAFVALCATLWAALFVMAAPSACVASQVREIHLGQQNSTPAAPQNTASLPEAWQKHYQALLVISRILDGYFLQLAPVHQQLYSDIAALSAKAYPLLVDIPAARDDARHSEKLLNTLLNIQQDLHTPMRGISTLESAVVEYEGILNNMAAAMSQVDMNKGGQSLGEMHTLLQKVVDKKNMLKQWVGNIYALGKDLQEDLGKGVQQLRTALPALWWGFYTAPTTSNASLLSFPAPLATQTAALGGKGSSAPTPQTSTIATAPVPVGTVIIVIVLALGLALLTACRNAGYYELCHTLLPMLASWLVLTDLLSPDMRAPCLMTALGLALILSWTWSRHAARTRVLYTLILGLPMVVTLGGYVHAAAAISILLMLIRVWCCGLPLLCAQQGVGRMLQTLHGAARGWAFMGLCLLTLSLLTGLTLGFLWQCPGFASLGKALAWSLRSGNVTVMGLSLQWDHVALVLLLLLLVLAATRHLKDLLLRMAHTGGALDSSAVPAIHAVLGCGLWGAFGFVALALLGLDVRSLAFIGGGLSVGVGFGLQHIMSNFFSGLVLIFSRAVKCDDLIEVGGTMGRVRSITTRSTVVETLDSATILVPNVEMLNSRMINWTKANKHVRCDVAVGVSYHCNPAQVIEALEKIAIQQEGILPDPTPNAFLAGFGQSTLDFVLRVWLADLDQKMANLSAIRTRICDEFRQQGIEIAFPQLDVTIKNPPSSLPTSPRADKK